MAVVTAIALAVVLHMAKAAPCTGTVTSESCGTPTAATCPDCQGVACSKNYIYTSGGDHPNCLNPVTSNLVQPCMKYSATCVGTNCVEPFIYGEVDQMPACDTILCDECGSAG